MYTLRLLGGFALLGPSGEPEQRLSQRRAEAVLAALALSGELGCTRDRLTALLWPESSEQHARHSLRNALHVVRQAVGHDAVLANGDALRLNPVVLVSDVQEVAQHLAAARLAEATELFHGPLLHGFHVDDAPEFERWVEDERARLSRVCAEALESLAKRAQAGGDWEAAAMWWTRATEHDPHNSRFVIELVRCLAATGDRANALLRAEAHRRRLMADLELEPDEAFSREVARIRAEHGVATAKSRLPESAMDAASGADVAAASGDDAVERNAHAAVAPLGSAWPAAGAATSTDGTPPSAPPQSQGDAGTRRRRWITLGVGGAMVLSVTAGFWWLSGDAPQPLDQDVVAVVPFSTTGHPRLESDASDLRDLLIAELLDGPAPRAVESAVSARAWRRAGGDDASRQPRAVDAEIANRTGASLVLRGVVDSVAGGRALTLTLVRLPGRRVVARRTTLLDAPAFGDSDAASRARRLLLEVLAIEAGQPAHRIGELLSHPSEAVRSYLAGVRRAESGLNCREMLAATWRIDSSLVYPGLACLTSAGYQDAQPWRDSVARAVWQRRKLLVHEDAAFADALAGPFFGLADDAEQRIALWNTAAFAAPDWWVPWAVLAKELVNFGPRTTLVDWRPRARSALDRALALTDWTQRGPVEMAFWMGVFDNDSLLARRAVDAGARLGTVEPTYPYTHTSYWFSAPTDWPVFYDAAFGEGASALALDPAAMPRPRVGALSRHLAVLAQGRRGTTVFADSFLTRWDRSWSGKQRLGMNYWIAAYWHARGDYRQWREHWYLDYTSQVQKEHPEYDDIASDAHSLVWNVLHLGAPEDTTFVLGFARMTRVADGDSVPAPPIGQRAVAACWVSQWRLSHGDTTGVTRAIALLRRLEADDRAGRLDGLPGSGRWLICPALLEAQRARVVGRGALEAARALDRLTRPLPLPRRHWWSLFQRSTHDQLRVYSENLDVARLLAAAGDTAAALAAVRRRPQHAAFQLDFFQSPAEHLRLEGRLAAAMADTVGAIAAYEDYLALRPTPPAHPPWRAEWDSVQSELARVKNGVALETDASLRRGGRRPDATSSTPSPPSPR